MPWKPVTNICGDAYTLYVKSIGSCSYAEVLDAVSRTNISLEDTTLLGGWVVDGAEGLDPDEELF